MRGFFWWDLKSWRLYDYITIIDLTWASTATATKRWRNNRLTTRKIVWTIQLSMTSPLSWNKIQTRFAFIYDLITIFKLKWAKITAMRRGKKRFFNMQKKFCASSFHLCFSFVAVLCKLTKVCLFLRTKTLTVLAFTFLFEIKNLFLSSSSVVING